MERKTIKFNTSGGFEVEYKEFLTGGEAREIQNVYLDSINVGMEGGEAKMGSIKGSLANKAQDKLIEKSVVSINGDPQKILERILDLPSKDFNEVLEKIDLDSEKKTEK